jgi:hypothetical protein
MLTSFYCFEDDCSAKKYMPLPNFWNASPFFWKKNQPAQPCTALHSKPKSDYLGEILNGFLIIIDRIAWVWQMGREMQPKSS